MKYTCTGLFIDDHPEVLAFEETELTTWAGRRGYRVGVWFCEQSQAFDTPAKAVDYKIRQARADQKRLQTKIEGLQTLLAKSEDVAAGFAHAIAVDSYSIKVL